ncbi:hypothetical protein [Microcoleus sp. D3_18_C4]
MQVGIREKEEGTRKKEQGRRNKEEGTRKKEQGRRNKEKTEQEPFWRLL